MNSTSEILVDKNNQTFKYKVKETNLINKSGSSTLISLYRFIDTWRGVGVRIVTTKEKEKEKAIEWLISKDQEKIGNGVVYVY